MKSSSDLDKYFETIYDRHCICTVNKEEKDFIQRGIENQVCQYLESTYKFTPCLEKNCSITHHPEGFELLRVGSFYEDTKIGFPNEFDFIAVLGTVDAIPAEDCLSHFSYGICSSCVPFKSEEFPDAEVRFKFTYGTRTVGCAEKLDFIYTKGHLTRRITADVVLALRYKNLDCCLWQKQRQYIYPEFCQEILKMGQFLLINSNSSSGSVKKLPSGEEVDERTGPWELSFTETETNFVNEKLSNHHKKAYVILKYLINGPFGEDLFKHFDATNTFGIDFFPAKFCISSYAVKCTMFYHHYQCQNENSLGDCILWVLNAILSSFHCTSTRTGMVPLNLISGKTTVFAVGNFDFLTSFYWSFKAFIYRLLNLREGKIQKCDHDLEDSLQEMALRLPIFHNYLDFLKKEDRMFSSKGILWCKQPRLRDVIEKFEPYLAKRKAISDCAWCDFEPLLAEGFEYFPIERALETDESSSEVRGTSRTEERDQQN